MGGDGGVIASNRRYMRGAGTADHTADFNASSRQEKKASDREDALERMRTCALSKAPLQFGKQTIVACPYGRLYHKEAAVEALLRRKQNEGQEQQQSSQDELGSHIRGLKDLYEVRFLLSKNNTSNDTRKSEDGGAGAGADDVVPVCPVTGQEFNGQHPVILLVPGNKETYNVVSQRAFKEMGHEALKTEYGPFKDEIRLAPPASEMEGIIESLETKRKQKKEEKNHKKSSKKGKKRSSKEKDSGEGDDNNNSKSSTSKQTTITSRPPKKTARVGLADVARGRVESAVKSNDVLSSLFTTKDKKISEKERSDNLFAR